jgi:hypothetical protein
MKNLIYLLIIAIFGISCTKGDSVSESATDPSSGGKGGSMARFAISGDILYTVSSTTLQLFNIENAADPRHYPERDVQVGFDIETIFPMDTLLFIGSRNGMFVYDIAVPRFPVLLSQVNHFRSCDPVVAQGNYAFVTLNTNSFTCGFTPNNVLDIYDISDLSHPMLKKTMSLKGPTGLGVDGDKLFVCDKGLKVFNISDPLSIRQIDDLAEIDEVDVREAYDVIPLDGLLILVAREGLFQFDYTGSRLKYVSKITIKNATI